MQEWRKRLAMLPEEVVRKTLENSTNFYLNIEAENREDPRKHYKYRFPGLRYPRQKETVATDTFFPSVKSRRGNTCSQFFVGTASDRWEVYPLKSESYNVSALQDYSRDVGIPATLKSDNAQSETGTKWTKHCRLHCIKQETTEPHTPWQNPAEPKIGQLHSMVKKVMRAFQVPLSEHDWAQKWCVDVHNISASRKLAWKSPMAVSEGHTQDISPFRFHLWEPIWYFNKAKAPKDPWQKARWLGFAHNSGDAMTYHVRTEGKDPQYLIRSIICTRRKNIGTEKEHVNECSNLQPELKDIELNFANKHDKVITEPYEGDSPIISGEDVVTQDPGENDDETPTKQMVHENVDDVKMSLMMSLMMKRTCLS
jgi:hypothetical protein